MNEKVTDDAVAAWLRELGYRASDGSLPTRTTLAGVSDVAADPVQFLMERYRSKSKTQSIKRYMELLDNSSDPHKADTLRKLSAAAKAKTVLEEGAAKAEALSTQIKDLNDTLSGKMREIVQAQAKARKQEQERMDCQLQASTLQEFADRCSQLLPLLHKQCRELAELRKQAEARMAAGRVTYQTLGSPYKSGGPQSDAVHAKVAGVVAQLLREQKAHVQRMVEAHTPAHTVPISSASSSPSKRIRSLSRDIDQSGDQVGSPVQQQEQQQEQDLPPLLAAFQPSPHLMQQVRQLRKEAPDAIMEALCTLTKADTSLARDDQALLQSDQDQQELMDAANAQGITEQLEPGKQLVEKQKAHLRVFARNLQLQQLVGQLEAKLAELQAKPAVQQLLAQPAIATKLKVVELKATIDEHDAQRERLCSARQQRGLLARQVDELQEQAVLQRQVDNTWLQVQGQLYREEGSLREQYEELVDRAKELVRSQLVQLYQQACYASSSASSAIRQELSSSSALPLALLAPTEGHIRDNSHTAATAAVQVSPSGAGLPVMLHRQSLALQCMASRSSGALGAFAGTPSSGLVVGGLGGSAGELEQALADVLDSAAGSDTVAALRCPQALYTGLATALEDAQQLQATAQQANRLRAHQQQQAQQLQQQSNALCASAHAYKQHQLAHMLPQAEAASTKAALVLQQAQEDLLGAVDDWWHLPAVNAAADNRYGDENMAGWRDRIREVHARLAQLGARN